MLGKAEDTLEQAVDTVIQVATAFGGRLAKVDFDSAEVSLGIKISGKGKFIVAEAAAEASLSVKIVFKAPKAGNG